MRIKEIAIYPKNLIKWLCLSFLVGIIGGTFGSIFHIGIDYVTEVRIQNPFILWFLPLGGVVIAFFYYIFKKEGKLDTNRVLDAVKSEEKVPLIMAPLIFISTLITHFLGGSAGREGAALQLGGSIGYNTGELFRLQEKDKHIITMAGMSAVFAALFGTPLTAAVFSLEVVYSGVFHYAALLPCVISALIASQTALKFGLHPTHFIIPSCEISAEIVIKVIFISILFALVSILFCAAIKSTNHSMQRIIKNRFLRAFFGGTIIVAFTFILGTYDYNGAGMNIVERAINGQVKYEAFFLKIIFTALTIASGFKGGEIVPAFFVGSTFGCMAGSILGLDPGFAAALGFVGVFCGVVNCPIASIILSLEVFGGDSILIFALVCAICYMMSGYFGLYKSQEFIFSKLKDEKVSIHSK